jgi:hypothetical protein
MQERAEVNIKCGFYYLPCPGTVPGIAFSTLCEFALFAIIGNILPRVSNVVSRSISLIVNKVKNDAQSESCP